MNETSFRFSESISSNDEHDDLEFKNSTKIMPELMIMGIGVVKQDKYLKIR